VKKKIALVVLALLCGGGFYVYMKINAASRLGDDYEAPVLTNQEVREGIRSPEVQTRIEAVEQIGKLSVKERKEVLLDALKASYAPTRLTALTPLAAEFGNDPAVIDRLLEVARDDPDLDVKGAAFTALTKSGDARVLTLAASVLLSDDASLEAKLGAAKVLDRLTGRGTAAGLEDAVDAGTGQADDLGMDWDDWLSENREKLAWDAAKGCFK
jgi:hypothetical protein